MEIVIIVDQIDVLAQIGRQRPVQGHPKLIQRIQSRRLDDDLGFARITDRNDRTRTVIVRGLGVVVQSLGIHATIDGLIGTISLPNNPRIPAFRFTRVVESDVISREVVIRAHGIIHVIAFAGVQTRAVIQIRLGIVIHGLGVRAAVDRNEDLTSVGVDADGVGGIEFARRKAVGGGFAAEIDLHIGSAVTPAVVEEEEVVAAVFQAAIGVCGFPLAVIVDQIHMPSRFIRQIPVHRIAPLRSGVRRHHFNGHGRFVLSTCGNDHA